jgi:hypothetical protein
MMSKTIKGSIAMDETFDAFLNDQGLLAQAEELAIKELIAEQTTYYLLWEREATLCLKGRGTAV